MIRRHHPRAKWSRGKRWAMGALLAWLLLLLCGEYSLLHAPAPRPPVGVPAGAFPPQTSPATPPPAVRLPREFEEAVRTFETNLGVVQGLAGNPDQPTADFTDIVESTGPGVPLPYDATHAAASEAWEACDQRNADFTPQRDALCQSYLSNLSNMRYIKAMSSRLLEGRTIKFRVRYAHNEIEAIVKVSQRKFYFEATSEFLAFSVDRALNFSRIPTSVFLPLPLSYMKAATAYSPLFSQWIERFVFQYNYTTRNFAPCASPGVSLAEGSLCAYVTIQLWMHDVHSALSTFLALPYEYDLAFAAKYYTIGHPLWPPKSSRLRAIGDVLDRFVFDFLIGNTDRGMNDHNNFVYGGCSLKTTCQPPPAERRTLGLAKYAFLDHGSSFYSHREPKGNAFFGDMDRIPICRFRQSTYESLRSFREPAPSQPRLPLVMHLRRGLSSQIFRVTHLSVFERLQVRLEKVLKIVERCLEQYTPSEVFSLPAYWEVHIPEEGDGNETPGVVGDD
ncbi:uncharacterized protein Tco025E_01157 [Trypanosoma conorhini]|uniref:Uncharacterized protein n=1 Tax=Trypanosoma conorhini TaxID=83891 RepID=A0A422Q9C8_9TRYP|nr:uncharacterized protein Tco025E_01157 [Trypanosoma conorhini]RNF26554.1 hypothetical protein Tco025E_01157 [Trypanosoma conorhini]